MKFSSINNINKYLINRKINITEIEILTLRNKYLKAKQYYEDLRHEQKKITTQNLILKNKVKQALEIFTDYKTQWIVLVNSLPCELDDSVPNINQVIDIWHSTLTKGNPIVHFELSNLIYYITPFGERLPVQSTIICELERALIIFVMKELKENNFIEYGIPSLVSADILKSCGHLPKEEQGMYAIPRDNKYLSPTGEVGLLCWLTRQKNYNTEQFICTVNNCYRREAGSSGRDTHGYIRVHEFKKCEMVILTSGELSDQRLEDMTSISQGILQKLNLSHRKLLLGCDDVGHHASKTYDLEVMIRNKWTEVASISNCKDFQSYKLGLKYDKKTAHTLNGTAMAIPRIIAAILEQYQITEDNKLYIQIPHVLQEYMSINKILIHSL